MNATMTMFTLTHYSDTHIRMGRRVTRTTLNRSSQRSRVPVSQTLSAHAHSAPKLFTLGDRGSQITLVGLFSNVGLTVAKGLAGWYLHSASLLADAGHSASGEWCTSSPSSLFSLIP